MGLLQLNNKKKTSYIQRKESNVDNKKELDSLHKQKTSFLNNSDYSKEEQSNKSIVSFNNAKNFSIYNQSNNNNISQNNENSLNGQSKLNDGYSSSTFKERINQIDIK